MERRTFSGFGTGAVLLCGQRSFAAADRAVVWPEVPDQMNGSLAT
jgi:hypothetical protein